MFVKIKIVYAETTSMRGKEIVPLFDLQDRMDWRYKEQFFRPNTLSLNFLKLYFYVYDLFCLNMYKCTYHSVPSANES